MLLGDILELHAQLDSPPKMQLMGRKWPQSHSLLCWQRPAEPWEILGVALPSKNRGAPVLLCWALVMFHR